MYLWQPGCYVLIVEYVIVEADIAKTETTKKLHYKIKLDVVCEVEIVFTRCHDAVWADGAHENSDEFEISIKMFNTFEEPTRGKTIIQKTTLRLHTELHTKIVALVHLYV